MDCARKVLSFTILYIVFFVLPWLCAIRLLWELHQDTFYWTQEKWWTNTGSAGTILLTIVLFSCSLQIISFRSQYFVFPVILEILALVTYALTLNITYDPSTVLLMAGISVLKVVFIFWDRYQSKMNKVDETMYCV